MKEIKAFIRKEKLNEVAKHLKENQFSCFTVFEGEGVGDYIDPETEFPSLNFPFLHHKVVKIEMVIEKEKVDKILDILTKHAQTGKRGDGLIYVSNIDFSVRIKTGEHNNGSHVAQ
ncbi:P-II family nitrogen regulator [Flavobacterium sp. CS20]|uniref:P-II family nitrogen regulator n=1 Tax=Flavobacterium sp. CS20 TaxID=2775246 RepID=UPI001B3A7607|nr:P-II family nitrogen regulator [Flavobacterium sp. CS20]QTY26438.1 P-II family nitrogen regulator [Flavobacterium sp. CS20]